jgi:integrase/recombinase XerD
MFLSKNSKSHGRYYVYYKDENGKTKSITTGTAYKHEALAFLIAFANRPKEVKPTEPVIKPLEKFSELEDNVMRFVKDNHRTGTASIYKFTLRSFREIIGDKHLNEISIKDVEYYKSCRLKKVAPSTCNIDISTLKATFNVGIKFGWVLHNPVKGIPKLRIPQKDRLCMSDDEVANLLNEVKDYPLMRNMILFGLYTGCRMKEITNLQWKDIDLKDRLIHIRNKEDFNTKTGKSRLIPICDSLYSAINQMIIENGNVINFHDPDSYVFSKENNIRFTNSSITHMFKYYIRKAKLPEKFHFHCLRHTFITNCIKRGININYVQALAGHSELKTTLGYTHIGIEDLKRAILAID